MEKEIKEMCLICMNEFSKEVEDDMSCSGVICDNKCKQNICKGCLRKSIEGFYNDNKFMIRFPKCFSCDKRIPFKFIKNILKDDDDKISKIKFNIRMNIAVRCQGCEEISSFMVDQVSFEQRISMLKKLKEEVFSINKDFEYKFNDISKRFMIGEANGMDLVNLLNENSSLLECMADDFNVESDENKVPEIAKFIPDYERRAKFISDWLRSKKFVATNCCDHYLCFLCQRDWHEGEDCDHYGSYNDGEIDLRACPHCNLTIERTEGCSSITCYCGEYFCWDDVDPLNNAEEEIENEGEEEIEEVEEEFPDEIPNEAENADQNNEQIATIVTNLEGSAINETIQEPIKQMLFDLTSSSASEASIILPSLSIPETLAKSVSI